MQRARAAYGRLAGQGSREMNTVTDHDHQRAWRLARRVLPQHTDHAGVMWHGAYLAWLEEARVEALHAAGLAYADLSAQGLELPVVTLQIHYKQALLHGQDVEVRSWALPRSGLKLPWLSRFHTASGTLAAEAHVELVPVQMNGGQRRALRHLPAELQAALARLEQGPAA